MTIRTLRVHLTALLLCLLTVAAAPRSTRVRTPVRIPDIPGYLTLKCDMHTHTVFSDGSVWPDIRAEEAWREGLDAVAITDHIEYQPHRADLPTSHERSFEIAKPRGDQLDILVVRGSEITRDMPPGHLNAVFLDHVTATETDTWRDAVAAANRQGAFVFMNHPGWRGQQPDGVARWYPEHEELLEKGLLHGVEVINTRDYYPEAHRWCIEKGLAIVSNSDVHNPANMDYAVRQGDHRPLTLVFAKERSRESLREALFARRTAAYSANMLIGDARFLRPIFDASVRVVEPSITPAGEDPAFVQVHNDSEIDFELVLRPPLPDGVEVPEELVLEAGKTVLLRVKTKQPGPAGTSRLALPYTVTNLLVAPDTGLPVTLDIEVTRQPP